MLINKQLVANIINHRAEIFIYRFFSLPQMISMDVRCRLCA